MTREIYSKPNDGIPILTPHCQRFAASKTPQLILYLVRCPQALKNCRPNDALYIMRHAQASHDRLFSPVDSTMHSIALLLSVALRSPDISSWYGFLPSSHIYTPTRRKVLSRTYPIVFDYLFQTLHVAFPRDTFPPHVCQIDICFRFHFVISFDRAFRRPGPVPLPSCLLVEPSFISYKRFC